MELGAEAMMGPTSCPVKHTGEDGQRADGAIEAGMRGEQRKEGGKHENIIAPEKGGGPNRENLFNFG